MRIGELYELLRSGGELPKPPEDRKADVRECLKQLVDEAAVNGLARRLYETRYHFSVGANITLGVSATTVEGEPEKTPAEFPLVFFRICRSEWHTVRALTNIEEAARILVAAGYCRYDITKRWRQSVSDLIALDEIGWDKPFLD